jgi:hypothetical protein
MEMFEIETTAREYELVAEETTGYVHPTLFVFICLVDIISLR